MSGMIYFNDADELATFLKSFVGCTATFECEQIANGKYKLEFTGGF